ncbi:MAG TPA: prolipoprotein diacylglyceryl transferase [Solirubrobacteraceae bacterium]|nr:prolipoprotein diacylglyceryl transferase [Solirubrobacteraceae bacterium]
MTTAFIPSPSENGFHIGPLFLHAYGIMYVFAVTAAILIVRHRWEKRGGDRELVYEIAMWGFPAGVIGARIYFIITTFSQMPQHWWGPFAIWDGGLGIWGGIAGGAAAGIWRLKRHGIDVKEFMDVTAPALLVAQAIGRVGNYFNQELFGKPTTLPWGLEISPAHRPAGFLQYKTFQPTFLYELIFDLALACFLIWLGNHRKIKKPGLFALYVGGYSGFRIFEETLRIDYSHHILGLRLNFFVALVLCVIGLVWFAWIQWGPFHPRRVARAGGAAGLIWVVAVVAGCGAGVRVSAARGAATPAAAPAASYSPPARR